jgi:hypothetical protein
VPKTTTLPEQLDVLLDASNDQLLELIIQATEEGARRAWNYHELLNDGQDPAADVVNEGLAFVARLDTLVTFFDTNPRMQRALRSIGTAKDTLEQHGFAEPSDGDDA